MRDGRLRQSNALFDVSRAQAGDFRGGRCAEGHDAARLERSQDAAARGIGDGGEAAVERRCGRGHENGLGIAIKLTLVNMRDRAAAGQPRAAVPT